MPDYPYVYADPPLRPVEAGGTRLRLFRRRTRPEEAPGATEGPAEERWGALLGEAVEELNDAFQRAGSPFTSVLEEDDGFVLRISRSGGGSTGEPLEEVDEVLDPADFPAWLRRLHVRLGLLVDETA